MRTFLFISILEGSPCRLQLYNLWWPACDFYMFLDYAFLQNVLGKCILMLVRNTKFLDFLICQETDIEF